MVSNPTSFTFGERDPEILRSNKAAVPWFVSRCSATFTQTSLSQNRSKLGNRIPKFIRFFSKSGELNESGPWLPSKIGNNAHFPLLLGMSFS